MHQRLLFEQEKISARLLLIAGLLTLTACGGGGNGAGSSDVTAEKVACESLTGTALAGGTVISANTVVAGAFTPAGQKTAIADLPAFCRVSVAMKPSSDSKIAVEVWMPRENWNGRFLGTGNGGGGGAIALSTGMLEGLKRGFAVANTDLGTAPDANLLVDHPERWKDFGYRANHEMTVASKSLVNAYYKSTPRKSYFAGCSTGGQQAMAIAQRYPDDYNGIIAGAPANNRTHLHSMFAFNAQQLSNAGINQAKSLLISTRVIQACAGKDGGAPSDAFITDPRQCKFDAESLPKCTGADNDSCLTVPQLAAVKAVWNGVVNPRTGERIFTGFPLGAEGNPVFGLPFFASPAVEATQLYMFKWALGANWNVATFDRDVQMDAVDSKVGSILNANSTDYERFSAAGSKIMMFNGTADAGVPFADPLAYYERVVKAQGDNIAQTQDFFRFYLVPGMGHCSGVTGGAGPGEFGQPYSSYVPKDKEHDILLKLVDWVENGNSPESFIATKYADATGTIVAAERPICTYPKIPTYQGGDTSKATSFKCMDGPRNGVPIPSLRYSN